MGLLSSTLPCSSLIISMVTLDPSAPFKLGAVAIVMEMTANVMMWKVGDVKARHGAKQNKVHSNILQAHSDPEEFC